MSASEIGWFEPRTVAAEPTSKRSFPDAYGSAVMLMGMALTIMELFAHAAGAGARLIAKAMKRRRKAPTRKIKEPPKIAKPKRTRAVKPKPDWTPDTIDANLAAIAKSAAGRIKSKRASKAFDAMNDNVPA